MTSEPKLIEIARQVVTDEEVLAAGVLQPRGAIEGMTAGLAANTVGDITGGVGVSVGDMAAVGGLAAGRAAAKAQDEPRYTMIVVTPTKVHLLSVHSTYLLHVRSPQPFAMIDRANCQVTRRDVGGAVWWTLTDTTARREYRLECSSAGTLAHGNEVMELLAGRGQPD